MTDREPPTADATPDPSQAATYHEWAADEYPLERGQAVYDIRQLVTETSPSGELGVAVVVDTHPTSEVDVHSYTFEKDGHEVTLSDYNLNRLYSDFGVSARVVTIAWDTLLDGVAPQWREHRGDPAAMREYVDALATDWDVALPARDRTYAYPESRLIPVAAVPDEVVPDV